MQLATKGRIKHYAGWGLVCMGWLAFAGSMVAAPFSWGISLLGIIPSTALIVAGGFLKDEGVNDVQRASITSEHVNSVLPIPTVPKPPVETLEMKRNIVPFQSKKKCSAVHFQPKPTPRSGVYSDLRPYGVFKI